MTREEIMELDLDALETRANAIALATDTADMETLETLNAELDAIEERKADIAREIETRKKDIAEVIKGNGTEVEVEERTTKMTDIEIRKSPEYLDAWVEYQKGRASEEQRALLTQNATDHGTIAVPTYVEDIIHTAWESNELVRRVRRTSFPGILKVGVEVSAEGPQAHAEGAEAITEEDLVLNYVSLVPIMLKKMVRFSDEVLDMRGQTFVDYIFDEIEYQIVKGVGDGLIGAAVSDTTGIVAVQRMAGASLTTADIINAEGKLGGEATNPVVITTRANAAALKAAALSAGYAYDPFDGMEVIFCDSSAITGATALVADPSGFQINTPNGDTVQFKFDDLTEADADMVRVIGRLYVGLGIVAYGKVVRIVGA